MQETLLVNQDSPRFGALGMLPPANPKNMLPTNPKNMLPTNPKNMLPTAPCPDREPASTLPHALVTSISSKPEELKADGQAAQGEGHRPAATPTALSLGANQGSPEPLAICPGKT